MNTRKSSHMGGIWERLIRTVRSVIFALLQELDTQLDDASLRTLDDRSRKYWRQITDAKLTPNHLLASKTSVVLSPPRNFQRPDLYSSKRWRRVQYFTNQFWFRWQRDYFTLQYKRKKWNTLQRNSQVGDMVILHNDDLSRNRWPLAKITKVLPSKDGPVRKVQLLIKRNGMRTMLERPINKLTSLVGNNDMTEMYPQRRSQTTTATRTIIIT